MMAPPLQKPRKDARRLCNAPLTEHPGMILFVLHMGVMAQAGFPAS